MSARKSNNVPAVRINYDRVDRSTEPAIINKMNATESEVMLNFSNIKGQD